jgi:F0F1-type ATP synthase membrane subunit c/vacuolar-type H+-ATPase subunit K
MYLAEVTGNLEILGKGLMMGLGMIGPAIGIGLIGNAFMNAVGRNPEAAKFLGQILVIIGIIELMALLVFASLFII